MQNAAVIENKNNTKNTGIGAEMFYQVIIRNNRHCYASTGVTAEN